MCMNKLSKSKRFSHEYRRIQYCFACFSRSCFSLVYFSVRYTSSHVNPSPKRAVNTDMPTIKRVSDHMTRMDRAQSDAIRGRWSLEWWTLVVRCFLLADFHFWSLNLRNREIKFRIAIWTHHELGVYYNKYPWFWSIWIDFTSEYFIHELNIS